MNKIIDIIHPYYLKPENFIHQAISILNKHFLKIVLIISITSSIYPIIQAVNLSQQMTRYKNNLKNIKTKIIEKEDTLQTKLQEKGNNTNTLLTPTKINQQLENLFKQQSIEINHLQWELEQDKQVNILLTQKARNLFDLIHQLNQIDYLRMKELTLTRLDYQQLVQLNATLQIVKQ